MTDSLMVWLPNIATFLLVICYLPQIVSNAKTKNVEGINPWFFIILVLSLSMFLAYNILLFIKFGVYFGIITEAANVLLAVVVLIQVFIYRKK